MDAVFHPRSPRNRLSPICLMNTQHLIRLHILSALLLVPATLHGQAFLTLTAASASYTLSADATGYPGASITYSDASPASSTLGYTVNAGPTSSSLHGDNGLGNNVVQVSLRASVNAESYLGSGTFGWATSQANASQTFAVTSPVSAVFNYGFINYGSYNGPYGSGNFVGDSNWALSLTSSSGATLLQESGNDEATGTSFSGLSLGVLQPGETYTLSASVYAHAMVEGPVSGRMIADIAGVMIVTPVPEPATYGFVVGIGLLGVAIARRSRRSPGGSSGQVNSLRSAE